MAVPNPLDHVLPLREAAGRQVLRERRRRHDWPWSFDDDFTACNGFDFHLLADGVRRQHGHLVLNLGKLADLPGEAGTLVSPLPNDDVTCGSRRQVCDPRTLILDGRRPEAGRIVQRRNMLVPRHIVRTDDVVLDILLLEHELDGFVRV